MGDHIVEQGEYLSLIAEHAGFRDAMTVWNAPENAALRKLRDNPQVLFPGDVIFVPEKEPKALTGASDQRHVFAVKADTLKLQLVLLGFDNQPLTDIPVILDVEGETFPLVTNGAGEVACAIPRSAISGRLRVVKLGIDVAVQIGHLDPVEEESGWRARLVNLGYYRWSVDDSGTLAEKLFSWALEEFQCDMGLKVTGKPDAATLTKLKQVHES